MRVQKPVTDAEWTFGIANGPSEAELVALLVCKTLGVDYKKELCFQLSYHPHKWLGFNIRFHIKKIEKTGEGRWIVIGDWIEAKFKDRPCSFKAEYSSCPKLGRLTFSFKYGQLLIDKIDGFAYVSFGEILSN
ncbi:MAG: hypothetical protein US31_C0003G0003 [Berkelbacteria bacterium GW2011_GWA1_36_9]|uniref:Uncharacterized protein n=1 Tax=Berkelbacteria bacterium GW2011_GWA1_36_9 TaxID=1618331 RepID=A0A0G0I2R1_9BACT|nr:MAG: hypothetical protein US31_C0003G0003 [Berkelbacteria bacterium GW2011_GWA1_36_9]